MQAPFDLMATKLDSFVNGFFLLLPNIFAAILFMIAAVFASHLAERVVRSVAIRRDRPDLGSVLGSLARGALMVTGFLFAAAIVFPSVNPGDILSTLGIGSIAIGFAFKDILQNLLAGLLLLINRPYRRGDQIVVNDFEGTVEHIESRATLIRTYDGRRVIIPNSDIYTTPVIVNSAYEKRRDDFVIGIGYGDDPAAAVAIFESALLKVEGVLADPAPEVLPWALNESSVDLKARWWTNSVRTEQVHVRARVVLALFQAAKAHGIDLPFPTQIMLWHDQTEETDGDRNHQREGWPGGSNVPKPRVRRSDTEPVRKA